MTTQKKKLLLTWKEKKTNWKILNNLFHFYYLYQCNFSLNFVDSLEKGFLQRHWEIDYANPRSTHGELWKFLTSRVLLSNLILMCCFSIWLPILICCFIQMCKMDLCLIKIETDMEIKNMCWLLKMTSNTSSWYR